MVRAKALLFVLLAFGVSTTAGARRPLAEILGSKKVSATYSSSNDVQALTSCLLQKLEHIAIPTSLIGSHHSFDNTRVETVGNTTHISVDPSFGGSGAERNRMWAFTASLTPTRVGTQVEIRQRGKSYNHWRPQVEQCVTASLPRSSKNAAPVATLGADVADEISKLAVLRDRGIITEEEFQSRKRLLLGR